MITKSCRATACCKVMRALNYSRIAESFTDVQQLGWLQNTGHPVLHAKVYILKRRRQKTILYIGSANATQAGLINNIEAGIFIDYEGYNAVTLNQELSAWIDELKSLSCCVELTQAEKDKYANRYRPAHGFEKKLNQIVGAKENTRTLVIPKGKCTWIELAVRGGSNNQIEICKDMAKFFTKGKNEIERTDFVLVDARTGIRYPGNSYRFRSGNAGYRVEVNTDLSRTLDLRSASERRDIILFEKTQSRNVYLVELYPSRSQQTRALIKKGVQEERVYKTTKSAKGRFYYL